MGNTQVLSVPRGPNFKMRKTQILNTGISQSGRGDSYTPSQRAPIVGRCRGHLAREGAGWSTVGCVSPSPPGASLGPPPHSGCPPPPGSLGLWPRARPTHRRMYATSSRSMTRSSQPHRSSAWWVPCCRTQKGCRGALPARAPRYPKEIARKSPSPPEQVAVATLIDQCIELKENDTTLKPNMTFISDLHPAPTPPPRSQFPHP